MVVGVGSELFKVIKFKFFSSGSLSHQVFRRDLLVFGIYIGFKRLKGVQI